MRIWGFGEVTEQVVYCSMLSYTGLSKTAITKLLRATETEKQKQK